MKSIYLGYSFGTFKNDDGEDVPFRKLFFAEEQKESERVKCSGYKALAERASRDLEIPDLQPLDEVNVLYDRYGRVVGIEKL